MSYKTRSIAAKMKVNVKSLAAESKIIRNEERKFTKEIDRLGGSKAIDLRSIRGSLNDHRRVHLRNHSRVAYLAYAFTRNQRYKNVESNARLNFFEEARLANDVAEKLNRHWLSKYSYKYEPAKHWTADDIKLWMNGDKMPSDFDKYGVE